MPRFHRYDDYYAVTDKTGKRRYVLKKEDDGKRWVAEAHSVDEDQTTHLMMRHSYIPKKREASRLVDRWMQHGY